jgi:TorA maturation chaperone TorD
MPQSMAVCDDGLAIDAQFEQELLLNGGPFSRSSSKMAMRGLDFDQAIRAAGGNGVPLRGVGMSFAAMSPAENVTSVDRAVSSRDYCGIPDAGPIDEVDAARAREYALLSVLLKRAPDEALLFRLASLSGDSSPLGTAHAALGEAAAVANVERVEREFFDLFIGVGRGELVPYGSYYLTGFLNERPLARLRDDLARFGVERVESEAEPEDHAAMLCELMAGFAARRFDVPAGADRELFERHLLPWIDRFFADLEHAEAAELYRRIGALGRVFMEIESEAFTLTS